MKGFTILATVAALGAICAVHAEDAKMPDPDREQLLQERPKSLPEDTMREPGTTDMGRENDNNITRPRTREDTVRDILNNRPSGTHGKPIPELPR